MRTIIKTILLFVLATFVAIWILGPEEPADLVVTFDNKMIDDNLVSYLENKEKKFDDIIPGVKKRIIWNRIIGKQTPLSIIYIHGFSATSEEIRPVPDLVAKALGANLFFTRLTGHGRGPIAMTEPRVIDWMNDIAEALEIGRRIGKKVVVISTSTGSTIVAAAALNPELSRDVSGFIFVSPNFGINNPLARLLTWPGARSWVPIVGGKMRKNSPRNKLHAKYWTTSYPTVATLPMAAVIKAVIGQDFSKIRTPALFYYSLDDKVVKPEVTRDVARRWGGKVKTINVVMSEKDDQYSHIIAGDIVSPNQTNYAIQQMLQWIKTLP